jgi:L-malate glycosyltransferase
MRVLYLNHTAVMSGAERSLLTLIKGLPEDVEPVLACPPGPLAYAAGTLGLPVMSVHGTDGSLRLHPAHTPRAAIDLGRASFAVRKAARKAGAELVHANTTRAGLVASAVTWLGGPPVVAHVRDRLPRGAVSDVILKALAAGASVVIANSRYTAERIPSGRAPVRVIPNPVDVEALRRNEADRADARHQLGLEPEDLTLAVIGQLTPWKNQDLAIRAAASLAGLERNVRLLIVGSAKFTSPGTRYDNRAYAEHLRRLAGSLGLGETVWFMGEREDVPLVLAASDLLLAPSWEEPFGRSVVEAMAAGVPVIATEVGGPAEIVENGVDGVLLPPRDPEAWAAAVRDLIADPDRMKSMARVGRERAVARFGVERHVAAVLDAYRAAVR